jgi:hypothetical protein
MRSRRAVCVLLRQERKAVQEEDAARVASLGVAEDEWWIVLEVAACTIGNWVDVVMGALSIQSGMLEFGDDIMVQIVVRQA